MAPIFSENVISLGNGIIKGWNLRPNFEFFPHNFKLDHFLVRKLRAELNWFHAENSTSATMFSNREATEKIITRLASLGPDGNIIEPGVTLFGHHQYLNYYGQPEAHLLCSHSTGVRHQKREPFRFIATLAMLCLPMLVRDRLDQIYVDSLVNSLDIKDFVDNFSSQITAQMTLAVVIMAIDTGFLTVQGLGTGMVAEYILKGSIVFCVGCMFSGMFAQYFAEKLKMLRFAAYYLDQGMTVVIGVFSAPRFFCIMRQTKILSYVWQKVKPWTEHQRTGLGGGFSSGSEQTVGVLDSLEVLFDSHLRFLESNGIENHILVITEADRFHSVAVRRGSVIYVIWHVLDSKSAGSMNGRTRQGLA
ncbi:hypothetical protein F4604DRAFT_1686135 [Suillus subluteus]|nr:hypothetical protein F4604DRAFT_1686135 [Suillus subluteus]